MSDDASTTDPIEPEVLLDRAAEEVARDARQRARNEGCDCNPDVEVSPTVLPPFWSPVVVHDEWCKLVATFTAEETP